MAISPDDRIIAAVCIFSSLKLMFQGSLDHVIRAWDAQTGYFFERFEGHEDSVYSVAFSPDGMYNTHLSV